MSEIIDKNHPTLRQIATEISPEDIKSSEIQKIIREMKNALEKEIDGVAIAAPQINYSKRIFVVSHRAFERTETTKTPTGQKGAEKDVVFINPKIVKLSSKKNLLEEGCLSVRHFYGKILRSDKATVEAYDEFGQKFERGGSGLLAQIFQHEIDHLNGKLFLDNAIEIQEITPEELEEYRKNLKAKRDKMHD